MEAMHRRVVDVCRSDGRTWSQRREVAGQVGQVLAVEDFGLLFSKEGAWGVDLMDFHIRGLGFWLHFDEV